MHWVRWVAAPLAVMLAPGALSGAEQVPEPPSPLDLGWCIERAAAVNPQIAMDAASVAAAGDADESSDRAMSSRRSRMTRDVLEVAGE